MDEMQVSIPDYLDWSRLTRSLQSMAAYTWTDYETYNLASGGEPERVRGSRVTASLFNTIGIQPVLGRGFSPAEQQTGHDHVVVLTNSLWKQRFGSNPLVLDNQIEINHEKYTIVGVLPDTFELPSLRRADQILLPLTLDNPDSHDRSARILVVVGRLKQNTGLAEAKTEMDLIAQQLSAQFPDTNQNWGVKVSSVLREGTEDLRQQLPIYIGIVLFVLCLACANVGGVLAARLAARQGEILTRLALGAGRMRLVRQLFTEGMILSVVAGL